MQYVIKMKSAAFHVREIIQNYQTQHTTFNTLLVEVSKFVTGSSYLGYSSRLGQIPILSDFF